MSGKERSPRHRPWSVYRANTFDLSAEMMGLALSGNYGNGLHGDMLAPCRMMSLHTFILSFTGNSQDPDEPVLEFSVGKLSNFINMLLHITDGLDIFLLLQNIEAEHSNLILT